jgi:hypothetical protein
MIELINRIWRTLSDLLKTMKDYVSDTTASHANIHSRLDAIFTRLGKQDLVLAAISARLDTIQTLANSTDTTLLGIDTVIDGMVDILHEIRDGVTLILAEVTPLPTARILFTFTLEGESESETQTSTGDYMKITVTQKFAAAIQPVDKFGNNALVDGKPVWEAADPTIISLVPSVDGLSVNVIAVGKVGTSQVSCTVDADLGTGVKSITDAFQVDVVAGQAIGLGIVVGEAVEQDVVTNAAIT